MTAAPMTFPGSRVLLGWWRELAGLSPRRLWVAHLLLHRVEALVETIASRPLATLARALLGCLQRSSATPEQLAQNLALDPLLLEHLLADLAAARLAERHGAHWKVTAAGEAALESPPPRDTENQRRSFFFVDGPAPTFLPLSPAVVTPLMPPADWSFDPSQLQKCINQPASWKAAHGFPSDVARLIGPAEGANETAWQRVVLDRAEQVLLVLLERDREIVGLSVQADGWLLGRDPVLTMATSAAWFAPGSPDTWRQAWQGWCQQRSLPGAEVDACHLELVGHRLRVRAPGRLVERLRTQRSDAIKGEAWLLAGNDRVRPAACIELETL